MHKQLRQTPYMQRTHCEKVLAKSTGRCDRCHEPVHVRKPYSLQKSMAYLLVATILLFPANTEPVMTISQLGSGHADTILSGVISLANAGIWGIAIIVFIASILVPFFKIAAMLTLLLTVHFKRPLNKAHCTRLFAIVRFIGKWSMLDIFIVAVLVSLVNLQNLAQVESGLGATTFALVVIFTMLSANAFDTRLLWDLEHE